ncbi:reverse transcriptase [Senna tora]|uniref:Reverse transcriptase n=1 Tax=Senna tora TaxID=362788 RepID=A0A834TIY8_9FABA|nr:reverse transcriptase [Senna tora]
MDLGAQYATSSLFQLSEQVHKLFANSYMDWHKAPTYVGCGIKIFDWASNTVPLGETLGLAIQLEHNATLKWDLCHVTKRVRFSEDVSFKESEIPYAKRFKMGCKNHNQGCTMTVQRLKQLVSQYNPNFIFLSETKQSFRYSCKVVSGLGFRNFVGTNSRGKSGGTILAWQDNQSCEVVDVTPNWIRITTHNVKGQEFQISFIYGFPALSDSKVLWSWFINMSATISCAWMVVGDFNQIRDLKTNWSSTVNGSPAFILNSKIQIVGRHLKQWNRDEVGSIQRKIQSINDQLLALQQIDDNNSMSSQRLAQQDKLQHEMEFYLDCEESMWAQKARMSWLVNGDRNTSYFHNIVNKRRIQNSISAIKDDNGEWVDGFQQKYDIPVLTEDHKWKLNKSFTKEEFSLAFNQMRVDSAPGPDGLNVRFFKHFWAVVKEDVFSMLHAFFDRGFLLKNLNRTYIYLIPKTNAPQTFRDYRPISLANVAYKLISKVLCNRLKEFLDDLIAPNQSAFIKGRLISDNTVLVGELMHKIRSVRRGKAKWCALKLDIQKAYDKLSWSFIEAVLTRMNFLAPWIQYIMQCVTTVSYQLIFNGGVTESFIPACGVR